MERIEKGKGAPGLTSLNCHCLFQNRYLLPCKHIFHEHMYGNVKLLTVDAWEAFQKMFEECGYEIYESRDSIIEFVQTKQQKETEDRRLSVAELTERIRDRYWSVEEMGDIEKTEAFISVLKTSLDPIISNFNEKPMIKYCSPLLNRLELDAFFQKYQLQWKCREVNSTS